MAVAQQQHAVAAVSDLVDLFTTALDQLHGVGIAPIGAGRGDGLQRRIAVPGGDEPRKNGCPDDRQHDHADQQPANDGRAIALAQRPLQKAIGQPCQHDRSHHGAAANRCGRHAVFNDARVCQQRPVPQIQRVADQPKPNENARAEHIPTEPGKRPGRNAETRSQHRQDGPPTRKSLFFLNEIQTQTDEHQARQHTHLSIDRAARRGASQGRVSEQRASGQLPDA